jgi:spore maturation protein A
MNILFLLLFCLSLAALTLSSPQSVLSTLLTSAERALTLCLSLTALYCVWMGVMNLLACAGAQKALAKVFRPLLRFLLGETDCETEQFVTLNLSSNLLGLGSAATPAGLEAVKCMERRLTGEQGEQPSEEGKAKTPPESAARLWYEHQTSALFLLNTCMLQLLPTGIISLRASLGSKVPTDVIAPSLICGVFSLGCATLFLWWHKKKTERKIHRLSALKTGKFAPKKSPSAGGKGAKF